MSIITVHTNSSDHSSRGHGWQSSTSGFLQVPREHRDVRNLVADHLCRLVVQGDELIMCVM